MEPRGGSCDDVCDDEDHGVAKQMACVLTHAVPHALRRCGVGGYGASTLGWAGCALPCGSSSRVQLSGVCACLESVLMSSKLHCAGANTTGRIP